MKKIQKILFVSLVLVFSGIQTFAQQITGTIKDSYDEPLSGVAIIEKGTNNITTSNDDGSYSINLKSKKIIEFSMVGFKTQEIQVGTSTVINVTMQDDIEALDDVVVTALGIKRDTRALGYAISSVKGEDLIKAGVPTNPLESLYGKAAGVGIQSSAAGPTGGINIKIRGAQGLESDVNTRPLFVVDGVPIYDAGSDMHERGYDPLNSFDYGSGINDINAEDIESMEILKGAKASVLYGSAGANGVVLITTKSGAGTRGLGVSVSYGHTWDVPYSMIDFQNEFGSGTSEYSRSWEDATNKTGRRIVSSRYNFGPKFDENITIKFFDGTMRKYVPYEDNYMSLFKTGHTDNVSVAIAGGNDKGDMRLSFNHMNYNGNMENHEMKRNSLSFNGRMKVSDFAEFEFINNLYFTKNKNRRPNLSTLVAWGAFNRDYDVNTATEDGYLNSMDALGNIEGDGWGWPEAYIKYSGLFPMLWNQHENRNLDDRLHNITSARANFKILPFLTIKLQAGLDYTEVEYTSKQKIESVNPDTGETTGGKFGYSRDKYFVQQYEAYTFFEKYFLEDRLSVNAFVGGVYYNNTSKSVGVGTMGGLKFNDYWVIENGKGWPASYDSRIASYSLGEDSKYSLLGQATIGWENMLYLELQARNDWSSTLTKTNRSYFYPGASITWNFTENFTIPYINYGKFRLSWADVGRAPDRYYAYKAYKISTLDAPNTNINKIEGPEDLFAGNLKPERKREIEVGFNLRFFKQNRLEIDMAYYNNTFYDQLMSVPLSSATGAKNIRINAGKVRNSGIEFFIKGAPIAFDKFRWELTFTAAKQMDKIIDLYPGITQKNEEVQGIIKRAEEGERMGTLWSYDYVRDENGNRVVNQTSGLYSVSGETKAAT